MAAKPEVIIADEPLSGADVSIRGQVLNLLLDIQRRRNVAYLMITHDISIARAFCGSKASTSWSARAADSPSSESM